MKPLLVIALSCLSCFALGDTNTNSIVANEAKLLPVPGDMAMGVSTQHMDFSSIENSPVEVALDRTLIKVPFGKFNAFNSMFIPGLSIERMGFRFNDSGSVASDTELYTIKTPLLFINKQDDHWTRILSVTPSVHSDLEATDSETFSLMGLLLWKYNSGGPHSWTFGAGANRLFGEYKPVPMFAYAYSTQPDTHYVIGFPASKAEHRLNQQWSLFSKLAPEGGNWRYRDPHPQDNNVSLSYKSWVATIGVRRHIKDKFWASFEVGQSFARTLELDDDASESELEISNGSLILFSIGLHP